ncbi:MAG: hypothetical protein RL154_1363, partial [Pseudomonadota bacterium]
MQSIFREYDIRGIFEKELTKDSVTKIGYFLGLISKGNFAAIGYDARTHSPQLFEWLSEGFTQAGISVLGMGLVTTGVNYFCAYNAFEIENKQTTPDICVMITGSHNPPEYNGFKITLNKLPFFGKDISALGVRVLKEKIEPASILGKQYTIDAKSKYIDYVVNAFNSCKDFKQNIVLDCGNGVAGVVLPDILQKLNINGKFLFLEPDGTFPNHHPDPSEEHNL